MKGITYKLGKEFCQSFHLSFISSYKYEVYAGHGVDC